LWFSGGYKSTTYAEYIINYSNIVRHLNITQSVEQAGEGIRPFIEPMRLEIARAVTTAIQTASARWITHDNICIIGESKDAID